MPITCIERIMVAVTDLDAACKRWSKAGFAVASKRLSAGGLDLARLYAGAVEIDLVAVAKDLATPDPLSASLDRGGGIIGWTWGGDEAAVGGSKNSLMLPISDV